MTALVEGRDDDFKKEWERFDYKKFWNFERPWREVILAHGTSTIGSVAMDADGRFAVCNSTGGSSPMLRGRVGDSPIIGCGYYAGKHAAIAATGIGEAIVEKFLCRTVHDWIEAGLPLQQALDRGVALFPEEISVGLIGVSRDAVGAASNRPMPWHGLEAG